MKKWALTVLLTLFGAFLLLRSFRKKRTEQLVALSKKIHFTTEDLYVGQGEEATVGKKVKVHYVGRLLDGRVFDTSREGREPFTFVLGAGRVIAGWEKGVPGMRVGGKRRLLIPPALGYGDRGAGGVIPPGAALEFEIELLDVQPEV